MNREFRIFSDLELRVKKDGKGLEGYAAVFDKRSLNLGGFREMIRPGAFKRAIKEKQDVRCLFNHDPNQVLGRTKSGTMRMSEDSKGLAYDVDLPDTQTARDVHTLVDRGDVSGCSFSFRVHDYSKGQKWSDSRDEDGSPLMLRELLDLDVNDVGPVTNPAYPQTSVDSRMLWPDGPPEEVRAYLIGENRDSKKAPYGDVKYADPGYQKDKKKRYPLDTEEHIRAAWTYIHMPKNAKKYTAEQVANIKRKIVAAWKEKIDKDGPPAADKGKNSAPRSFECPWPEACQSCRDAKDGDAPCECDCQDCQDGDCENCSNPDCDDPNCRDCPMQADDRARELADLEMRARLAQLD